MIETILALILLPLCFVFLVHHRWENSPFVKTIELIPGPKRNLFLGNAMLLPSESDGILQTLQEKWVKQFGHIYRTWFANRASLQIASASILEKTLSSQTFMTKAKAYSILKPWLGEGLLLASGDKWKKNRRLLTPAFHFQILDNFFDVFNSNARILCDQLSMASKLDSQKPIEVDVFPFLKKCTLDIICEAAMGIKVNAQLENTEYIQDVHKISEIIIERFFSLKHFLPDWIYNQTSSGKEHLKLLHKVHNFTLKVIRERKIEIDLEETPEGTGESSTGIKKRRAFLDLILLANKAGSSTLSDVEIRNEVDTFMFEGHDTTASGLVWFFHCMGTNPECQKLVQEELDQVFGDSDRPCTLEDAGQLKYLECCIKESLRLYPPVPVIMRYIKEDTELGGYKIPAGVSISMNIFALHRNEEYFPDPLTFRPDRFLNEESIGRHPFAYIPFSAGPRNCIGQRFAMLEEKVLASTLLRRFRFTYDSVKHGLPRTNAELVLRPKFGMPLTITSLMP